MCMCNKISLSNSALINHGLLCVIIPQLNQHCGAQPQTHIVKY